MMRCAAWALTAIALLVAGPGMAANACRTDPALLEPGIAFPRAAADIGQHARLQIIVVGSASSLDIGVAGNVVPSYASRLGGALRRHLPDADIDVRNLSRRGATAAQMLAIFPPEVVRANPSLVVWQTGSIDAANNVSLDDFDDTLRQGIELLHRRKIDTVLVTPQYSRRSTGVANTQAYLDYMGWAAVNARAALFNRFEIMREWSDAGFFGGEMAGRPQVEAADRVHDCLAALLADFLLKGMALAADQNPETRP